MAVSAFRKAPIAALLMLSAAALPAHAGWFDLGSAAKTEAKPAVKADAKEAVQAGTTLEDSIQEARMLRLAGSYPEAIKNLSQLMMVASDDSRVISEYGKTLASMGRANDAVNFLTRAQQLEPGDWTIYSALGVAYDQIGDQKSAQLNYDQALKIKPEEPSVLSNYALSRMLAKDPDMARTLAARAEKAGGARDARIGRNIAMIRSLAPETPVPQAQVAQAPIPAPAAAAPRASAPVAVASNAQPPVTPPAQSENRVVMQKVPVDLLAGPVQTVKTIKPANADVVASAAPRPLQPKPAQASLAVPTKTAEAKPAEVVAKATAPAPLKPAAVKTVAVKFSPAPLTANKVAVAPIHIADPAVAAAVKVTPAAPVKSAEVKPAPAAPVTTAKTSTPVKAAEVKPAAVTPVATAKAAVAAPVKAADAKPVTAPVATAKAATPVKAAEANKPAASVSVKMTAPVKAAEAAKPETPKVLVSASVKAADAKPVVKTVGQKDAIPGLRLSANAY